MSRTDLETPAASAATDDEGVVDHRAVLAERLAQRFAAERRSFLRAGVAGAGAMALAGVGSASLISDAHAQGQPVKRGGTIRLGWIDALDTLDPHYTSSLGSIKVINNIFNGILKVTYDGKKVGFEPDLAERWDAVSDRVHVFRLRRGVKFHNGDPFNAEAVKWSIERVRDPANKSQHAYHYEDLSSVDVVDEFTVRLTFSKPYAFLPIALTGSTGRAGTIVNRSAIEKLGREYGRAPIGTGPFRFVSWRENDSIVLERNPDYFEKGLPYLDRVEIRLIREPSSGVAALLSGQVDGLSLVPFQFVPELRKSANVVLHGQVEGNYSYVGMNNRKGPFMDANLRRAVAFAIDRDVIVNQGYFGEAIAAFTPISPPMAPFYDPNIGKTTRGHRLDLKRAMEFRKKAAVQGEVNPVYIVAEGFTGSGGSGTRISQLLGPMLEKIGIKPRIELSDRAAWLKRRNTGDFDMFDEAWIADLDPHETITPEWSTGRAWNFVGYSNPEFDKLVAEASDTLDVKRRMTLYTRAVDVLMDDAPLAMLAHMKVFKAFNRRVRGFQYIPVDLLNLHTVSLG